MPEEAATQTDVASESLTIDQVAQKLGDKRAANTVTPENQQVDEKTAEEIKPRPKKAEDDGEETAKPEEAEAQEEATEEVAEPEEESESPEEQEQEEEEPADDLYDVKVNGKVETVTLEDLKRTYQKEKSADLKFEEAAKLRKEHDEKVQTFEKHYKEAGDHVIGLGQQLMQQLKVDTRYSPEEMESLRYTDVAEWNARKLELQEKHSLIQQTQAIEQQRKQQADAARKEQFERFAQEEAKKLKATFTDFKDQEVADKTIRKATDYAIQKGFTPDEINGTVRANMWEILINSMRYEQAKSKISGVTKEVKKAPQMIKPGTKQPPLTEVGKLERELAGKQAQLSKGGNNTKLAAEILQLRRNITAKKGG